MERWETDLLPHVVYLRPRLSDLSHEGLALAERSAHLLLKPHHALGRRCRARREIARDARVFIGLCRLLRSGHLQIAGCLGEVGAQAPLTRALGARTSTAAHVGARLVVAPPCAQLRAQLHLDLLQLVRALRGLALAQGLGLAQ